jgi:hypothetical protein
MKATKTHGEQVGATMNCESELKASGDLEESRLWTERTFENHGALYLDSARYERYVMKAKKD